MTNDHTEDITATLPKTRGDCINGDRPCPWVRCKHHLIWDFNIGYSSLEKNSNHKTDDEIIGILFSMSETCALDIADRGGATLAEIGLALNMCREGVRQIEECKSGPGKRGALERLRHPCRVSMISDWMPLK